MTDVTKLLPGTEVQARGLRWELVAIGSLGHQTLSRSRGLESAWLGQEFDILPFNQIEPVLHEIRPDKARETLFGTRTAEKSKSSENR